MTIRLVVFSDDWGRSPSSCQHLVRHLLSKYPITWVNTIGTRRPSFSRDDIGKAAKKLTTWATRPTSNRNDQPGAVAPRVLNPLMFPSFRRKWQRRLNARQVTRSVHRSLGAREPQERRVAITTIPIAADLPNRLDVDAWVYYCVDDFSVWPGLDGAVMDEMERELVSKMHKVTAVSETLKERLASMGVDASLLTHGIDAAHWEQTSAPECVGTWQPPQWWAERPGPKLVFWGVIDRRLDSEWCLALAERCGTLVIFGPTQEFDQAIARHPRVVLPGPARYDDLPFIARHADVLVMPYADLPVTRAMQPLKFKEYLASGRPVVARRLPAITDWSDAADLVENEEDLVNCVSIRVQNGVSAEQKRARQRLASEGWDAKTQQFEKLISDALSQRENLW